MKTKTISFFTILFLPLVINASFYNFNSTLIGNKAAGMGGAFTAVSGDLTAAPFYNPATLTLIEGINVSASVSLYNKYDIQYNNKSQFWEAPLRINQGKIVALPVSSGSLYNFKNFAVGLSIILPDFDSYQGLISSSSSNSTSLNFRDESLWIGGSLAYNLSSSTSIGLTIYYTSRSFYSSLLDRSESAGVTTVSNEEKSIKTNSLIYTLGFYKKMTPELAVGLRARLPSIPVSGKGSIYSSVIQDNAPAPPLESFTDLVADERIPQEYALGLAYEKKRKLTWSCDITFSPKEHFYDFPHFSQRSLQEYKDTWNIKFGMEYFLNKWAALHWGMFSNFSSQPDIPDHPSQPYGDHIDMWGFSTNISLFTNYNSTLTLGGYYSGGKGYAAHQVAQQKYVKIPKSLQVFSFLVGTAFNF
ncbi:MAG: hypothetical protein D6797_04930 [Bdellovibrio sp.]|nr:MAG: hypothetical protein D6797_04930 [Bdellovibrio sp.]